MTLVCPRCFGEAGLKKRIEEIRAKSPNEKCSFHPRYKGVLISDVAAVVDQVFRTNYWFGEPGFDSQEGNPLKWAVSDLVEAEEDAITDALIGQLIEDDDYWPPDGGEAFYAEDQNYVLSQPMGHYHSNLWRSFCESIVHTQRFFNSDARKLIEEIFDGIHLQMDADKNSPVYQLNPGDEGASIYRARVASSESDADYIRESPVKRLGPPPNRQRRPGRMNPAGIATFYGAFDLNTCLTELRPVVGTLVVGGRFELVRPIFVLDTTRFQAPIKHMSLFAKDQIRRSQQWQFMQSFMHEMSKPISPEDEHIDYIPTQAVAEFFAHHHTFNRSGVPSRIEAVIYKSAQYPQGRNIVLLADAAIVISEEPTPAKKDKFAGLTEFLPDTMATFLNDKKPPTQAGLRLDKTSLQTLVVQGAHYDATEFYSFE